MLRINRVSFFYEQLTSQQTKIVFYLVQEMVHGGPTAKELLRLLDQCDLTNSLCSTPCMTPCSSVSTITRLKASNVAFLNQVQNTE